MEVKGANPFLFTEDDYVSPNSGNSNPFLMGDDDFMGGSGGNDNPFLSQSAVTAVPAATATNPFAFDPMDLEPSEAQPATFQDAFNADNFIHDTSHAQEATNIFTETTSVNQNFYIDTNVSIPSIVPQKPTDLDLKFTNTVASDYEAAANGGPKRPPPPRPPPSKETQDLLMSVMGEMDAASTHLLDRIPPTRTPSPVSMRDLHSPSPTPEPQFGDLLDVSDAKTDTTVNQSQPSQAEDLFMSLADDDDETCDINQNPPVMDQPMQPIIQQTQPMIQKPQPIMQQPQPMIQQPQPMMQQQQQTVQPPRPVPPVRPPPPQRPQKPPQPNFAQQSPAQISGPPPKPPPPAIPQPPAAKPAPQSDEFLDMFGMQQPQTQKSMADIMNLYNTKQETPVDLLSDSLDTAMASDAAETSISESNSRKSSVPSSDNTVVNANATGDIPAQNAISTSPLNIQDNFLSPQQDMQMDTSDSQSKESVSSVTFNPFAAVEETSPTNPSAIPTQDFSSSLDNGVFHEEMPEITEKIVHGEQEPIFEPNVNEQKTTISSIFGVTDNSTYQETSMFEANTNTNNVFAEPIQEKKSAVEDIFGSTETTYATTQQDIFGSTDTATYTSQDTFGITDTSVGQDNFGSGNRDAFGSTNEYDPPYSTNSNQDAFGSTYTTTNQDAFGATTTTSTNMFGSGFGGGEPDAFDAFAAKFESVKDEKNGNFDAFGGGGGVGVGGDTWGNDGTGFNDSSGFGGDETFDAFLAMKEPPAVPQSTPNRFNKVGSLDSDEEKDFSVVIRPKSNDESFGGALPVLAPPPVPTSVAFSDSSRINPFDQTEFAAPATTGQDFALPMGGEMKRSDSQETPPTPLFDDDVSQPLEPFPRVDYTGEGWEMHLRQPNKKKITGQRFWKKIFVRLVYQQDCVLLQLYNQPSDKDPFQELPLQPCYSVSEIGAQQYDNFGKIFTLKLQYIFYKERPGVRPGQVKKAERITNKLSQFAAYAIQGDYQGCKEFGSDLKKLGLPVEHAPQVSQLMKLGSLNFEDLKEFSVAIEESLFKLQAHRDRALHYKMEEVQVTAVDELYVEQDAEGHIEKQIARVRLFFLGFLTGMPDIELGVNDMRRQGKEVVGRHDIIPVVTEEWIRIENVEFHSCVQQDEYNDTHIIKFKPPDACYIELLRFRVRPPKNRELPLQLKAQICITGNKVELRADVLVPGFASRKLGQVPCEDVMIRFPIPECWIYMFRVEKHFRYGSVKSAHRRTGKIKGIERILGTVDTLQESLIEVTSGQAKYEHQHRAIVWRCPRLPKEGQGAYTTHNMVCRLSLTSYDQMPDSLAEYAFVEFTMPATQVSHTTVRSVSLQNSDSDEPPEKYVRYLARHEYRVGIEHTEGEGPSAYAVATQVKAKPAPEEKPAPIPEAESSSDSD